MKRITQIGGAAAWLAVGTHVALAGADSPLRFVIWSVAFAVFGAGLLAPARLPVLALQVAAVTAMVLTLCDGFEGTLLVMVAMQLGSVLPRRTAILWIVAQTLLLGAAIGWHWTPRAAMLITPPYLGFQLLAYLALEALARESAANAELRATQSIIAGSTRLGERLRISRELHDTVGHRLTALSLHLEAALQKSAPPAREYVDTAQSLARQLLGEVRDIVATMGEPDGIDLAGALQTLTASVPRPQIHLAVEPDIRIDDPERARVVVRCTQEIITNAARHSAAENLWIVIDREGDSVRIRAHDDGRGSERVPEGFGLRAMRERVEGAGGRLQIETQPGAGFDVIALVPA
ncbi:MAG TPA: sensor histidine kinase [Thermoanaerobaculia bacterium]|nr:sensor histidine kinase [Thermoanaerobaculia bacterium]